LVEVINLQFYFIKKNKLSYFHKKNSSPLFLFKKKRQLQKKLISEIRKSLKKTLKGLSLTKAKSILFGDNDYPNQALNQSIPLEQPVLYHLNTNFANQL
jgi:hypothetical protein